MKNTPTKVFVLSICLVLIWTLNACQKDKEATGTDKELYDMALINSGFTWFKNSNALLNKSAGSGHSQPFLKTRYNTIAAAKLDSMGKIIPGTLFPEGSLIVKELYTSGPTLDRYAILYKNSGSADADAKGWVWGYVNADGTVSEEASNKGAACISCHSQSDNIDYMLMNKYYP
jgi:hypothetical protein